MKTCCRKELEDDKDLKELMLARLVADLHGSMSGCKVRRELHPNGLAGEN